MSKTQSIRFSVDTGGTFTDIVVLDEATGRFSIEKAPTTPENTLIGVLNAINKAKVDLTKGKTLFVYGSTTAINTVIERKGAKTAYLTSQGFRDIPEIARYNRTQPFNLKYHKPPQLIRRRLRFEVPERMNWLGEVVTELDTEAVREVARKLKRLEVKSLAICFLHSFKNDSHERKARDTILEEYPEISVSISSDIAREHREYERSMTTIIDAYIKPLVSKRLGELQEELEKRGFKGEIVLTRSDGGGMTSGRAKDSPINTLLSGPAGGVVGGLSISSDLNYSNIITMDMGGTSLDVSIIREGMARTSPQTLVHGYAVIIPNLDIHSVGAGGGSIAWIDAAGALHVGPQSAGAVPGPICYAQGGTEPTVTDALLCTGYIDPGYFLGGEMPLDTSLAQSGIKSKVCEPLKMDFESGASGILKVALSNMSASIRELSVKEGDDPRDFSLLCYGGGGPLFGAALIDELEMPSAIIPVAPANFSAWGMLKVNLRYDLAQTLLTKRLDESDLNELNNTFGELINEGLNILKEEGIPAEKRASFKSLDLRYPGQEHTVNVPLDFAIDENSRDKIYEEFSKVYQRTFGYTLNRPAEVIALRVRCIGEVAKPVIQELEAGSKNANAAIKGKRQVFCFVNNKLVDHTIYERSKLLAGNVIDGPALIEEPTSVTNVLSGYKCKVDKSGSLIITRK